MPFRTRACTPRPGILSRRERDDKKIPPNFDIRIARESEDAEWECHIGRAGVIVPTRTRSLPAFEISSEVL